MAGSLYLIPVTIGCGKIREVIPETVVNITISLRYFIVENLRSARRYLKLIDKNFPVDDTVFYELNENTREAELQAYIEPVLNGHDAGLMSEAGIPCIADPGANIVRYAHQYGIKVVPLTGPSSIFLALAASGLNGQIFTFHGYLPVKDDKLRAKIREIEKKSFRGETQIFMETPYRAQRMFDFLTEICNPGTHLCIAADITLPEQKIITRKISEWKRNVPDLKDTLVIFLLNQSES